MTTSVPRCNVLGVAVSAVDLPSAVDAIESALDSGARGYVCVTGVHGVIESQKDDALRAIHNRAILTVPDGVPLVWVGRRQGFARMGRVYGPDLMMAVLRRSVAKGRTHFLLGGAAGVAEALKTRLEQAVPGVRIVGTFTPPFGPLDEAGERELRDLVAKARPDFTWVGLSTPKQERFMAEHADRLDTRIMLGVGAAFDVHAGLRKDAPGWAKRSGLQWLHRLCQEPRRLWRRYVFIVPAFLALIALQALGLRKRSIG